MMFIVEKDDYFRKSHGWFLQQNVAELAAKLKFNYDCPSTQ